MEFGILDFPPFYIVKSESDIAGTKTDMIRAILNHAGIQFTEKGYPPKRLYKNVAEGKTHIWMGIKGVPTYDEKVLYSKNPIDSIEIRIYTTSDNEPPATKEALKGLRVITIRGYSYGGMIKYLDTPENSITTDPTDSHTLAFKKLLKKRADCLIDYKSPAETTIKDNGFTGLKHSSLMTLNLYFIVPKSTPDAAGIMKKMEDSYAELMKQGKI